MTPYALANHVFVCLQDEHVVFLDVRNDRYFSLEAERTCGLAELVRGWPVQGEVHNGSAKQLLEVLTGRGLVTSETRLGKDATPIECEPRDEEISADVWAATPAIGLGQLARFIAAALFASLTLRFVSFERMIHQAARRQRRAQSQERAFDRERTEALIAVFASLRPYFFTAKDACLFEALALGTFLSGYGIPSRWVFGVQARPFAAHCWLQQEGVVLNDTVEHISRYSPIMIV